MGRPMGHAGAKDCVGKTVTEDAGKALADEEKKTIDTGSSARARVTRCDT